MKKNAYADSTIKGTAKRLRHLQRNCDLRKPEAVKGFIAKKQCSNAHKESLIEAYDKVMKSLNVKWEKPFYKRYDKLPKIPTEEKLNMLTSHASHSFKVLHYIQHQISTKTAHLRQMTHIT